MWSSQVELFNQSGGSLKEDSINYQKYDALFLNFINFLFPEL